VFTKPPFLPVFSGILLVPLIIWFVVSPPSMHDPCPCVQVVDPARGVVTADTLGQVPPNKRLKLAARVDYGMNCSSARRSLGASR
jgi:hypothetical protein